MVSGRGGGHHQVAGPVGQGIAPVPEVAGLVHVLHLGVRQGGDAVGAPVDDPAALVDEALLVELTEGLPHGLGAPLVHGEPGPVPVAGGPQLLLLGHDAVAVLMLPGPHPLQELLPAQVVAGEALLHPQLLLHLDLGGDAGMVRAGDPQGGVALHPLKADQDVLEGAVHGVAHVELPGDVGRGHDNGVRLLLSIADAGKALVFLPLLVDPPLHFLGLIDLRQFFSHRLFPFWLRCRRLASAEAGTKFPRCLRGQVPGKQTSQPQKCLAGEAAAAIRSGSLSTPGWAAGCAAR